VAGATAPLGSLSALLVVVFAGVRGARMYHFFGSHTGGPVPQMRCFCAAAGVALAHVFIAALVVIWAVTSLVR
jgi:hypothetical protein